MARRSESLNEALHQSRTPSITDIWKNLIKRGLYGKGKGYEKTSFTLNNVHSPSVIAPWQKVQPLNGATNPVGPCAHNYNDVYWGYNQHNYGPEQFDFRGPVLCKKQFIYDFEPNKFVNGYVLRLRNASDEAIGNRYQEHYTSLSNKVVCVDGAAPAVTAGAWLDGNTAAALLPTTEATSTLTQDILDYFVPQLTSPPAPTLTAPEPN
ncbi:MAG: hypothetical protein LBK76_09005 [Verrucomicrobiales bacterium]|nr:hypothetical protein [Verrucomicrobiales bacterium]